MTKYKQQQQQKKKKKKIGGKTKTRLGREKTIADAAEKNRAVHRQWTIGGCNSSTRVDSLSITSSSPCAEHKKKNCRHWHASNDDGRHGPNETNKHNITNKCIYVYSIFIIYI